MRHAARLLTLLVLALAVTGCGLNPKQQTILASDGAETLLRDVNDRYERKQVTPQEFVDAHAAWINPMRAAVDAMWAHADDAGATLATSPWWAAFRAFTESYAKGVALKQQADRRPPQPATRPAAATPGAQPPGPATTDDPVPPP